MRCLKYVDFLPFFEPVDAYKADVYNVYIDSMMSIRRCFCDCVTTNILFYHVSLVVEDKPVKTQEPTKPEVTHEHSHPSHSRLDILFRQKWI